MLDIIKKNNETHVVDAQELQNVVAKASEVYKKHFDNTVWFERSVFINWTCGIADCKYCYLSTQPKQAANATRHPASILAEVLICKLMGWHVGYITGGLRVESTEYLITLLNNIEKVYGQKIMMNFGPYTKNEVTQLSPHVTGMGSAIESFDEELHKFICPSKPLPFLMNFLGYLKEKNLKKLITIILGIGEKKSDLDVVIQKIKEYDIEIVQLCFLKPQEQTVFDDVPPPNPEYMTWWIAKLRIAIPTLIIKVALVRERVNDTAMYLEAGANAFSRFMVFKDFNSEFATQLEVSCKKGGRILEGNFTTLPELDILNQQTGLEPDLHEQVIKKAEQYYRRLQRLAEQ